MKTNFTMPFLLVMFLLAVSTVFATNPMVAPPSNDLIFNAIDLNDGPLPYSEANVNFQDATITGDNSSSGCAQSEPGIWYKFYATKVGNVSAFIQTDNSAIVTFYTAEVGDVQHAVLLTYVDQASNPCDFGNFSQINTVADTYYYIFMRNLDISNVAINVSNALAPPENDFIISATEVAVNNPANTYEDIHFLTATNTLDGGQVSCDTDEVPGIWYKFFTEVAMEVTANMSSGDNISSIIFYKSLYGDAANSSDLEHVAQAQNQCGIQNNASITTEAGNWYYIFASTLEPYADVTIEAMVLGVSENELEGFVYYPNPVKSELNLSSKANIDQVLIFNLMGQQVFSEKMNTSNKTINISNLSKGLYVMMVTSEGNTASFKVLKE